MSEAISGAEKPRKRRRMLHEYGHHNDIRYRGPLSYMDFQVLGWLCIVMYAVVMMIRIAIKVNPAVEEQSGRSLFLLQDIAFLSLPFLLIANYARILSNAEGYAKQLLRNGLVMLGIFGAFNVFFYHFVVDTVSLFSEDKTQVLPMLLDAMRKADHFGFAAFNVFVDLFLCTLFMFFLNYRPKRVFTEWKIIIFRLFALLPLGYEVASILIKGACAAGRMELPVWAYPLLTVKPPMAFALFVALAIIVKTRELRYVRHGNTHEDYQAFLQTRRNSLHFSAFITVLLVVASIADLILLMVLLVNEVGSLEALETLDLAAMHPVAEAMGFGEAIPMILVAPLMLLFSYTRVPKFKDYALLIPVVGVALMVIVVLQGAYQILAVANIPPVNFNELKQTIQEITIIMSTQ